MKTLTCAGKVFAYHQRMRFSVRLFILIFSCFVSTITVAHAQSPKREAILKSLRQQKSDQAKLSVVQDLARAKLECALIADIMRTFKHDAAKVDAGATLYPQAIDPGNFFLLTTVLKDEYFRNQLRQRMHSTTPTKNTSTKSRQAENYVVQYNKQERFRGARIKAGVFDAQLGAHDQLEVVGVEALPQGALSDDEIDQSISAQYGRLDACYSKRSLRTNIRGDIKLSWTIHPNGKVRRATVHPESTIFDAWMRKCTRRAVGRMRFPRSAGPRSVTRAFHF